MCSQPADAGRRAALWQARLLPLPGLGEAGLEPGGQDRNLIPDQSWEGPEEPPVRLTLPPHPGCFLRAGPAHAEVSVGLHAPLCPLCQAPGVSRAVPRGGWSDSVGWSPSHCPHGWAITQRAPPPHFQKILENPRNLSCQLLRPNQALRAPAGLSRPGAESAFMSAVHMSQWTL